MCIFLTNVLQNLRKVSVQSYKMVQDTDILYPSQHIMSSNHQPASEMPFKCFRCCIAKKEEREAGKGVCGGGGWRRLESPDVTNSIFVIFFACVVVFVRFGGINCRYSLFH